MNEAEFRVELFRQTPRWFSVLLFSNLPFFPAAFLKDCA
jgi:hypothetical protein